MTGVRHPEVRAGVELRALAATGAVRLFVQDILGHSLRLSTLLAAAGYPNWRLLVSSHPARRPVLPKREPMSVSAPAGRIGELLRRNVKRGCGLPKTLTTHGPKPRCRDQRRVVVGRQLGKMVGSSPVASSVLQEPPPEDFPEKLE